MASVFKVANQDATTVYDFLSGSNYIRLIDRSIQDKTTQDGDITELEFKTIAKGTAAQIRGDFEKLERLLQRASIFINDETSANSIWIHAASDGETERRCLIHSWTRQDTNEAVGDVLLDDVKMVISNWVLIRAPYWEALLTNKISVPNTYLVNLCSSGANGAAAAGDVGWEESNNITYHGKGTVPGRIKNMQIEAEGQTTSPDDDITRFWFGIKKVNSSSISYWRPDLTTAVLIDVTSVVDSNGTDGYTHQCTFTSSAWSPRIAFKIPLGGTPIPENWRGEYMVLARMRNGGASTVVRTGLYTSWETSGLSDPHDVGQDVYVETQYYKLYEMGIVQVPSIPFRNALRDAQDELDAFHLGINAERISGSDNWFCDYLILIPYEYFISISNSKLFSTTYIIDAIVDELDYPIAMGIYSSSGNQKSIGELAINNFTWPTLESGETLLFVAAGDDYLDTAFHHALENSGDEYPGYYFDLTFEIVPRYLSYNND